MGHCCREMERYVQDEDEIIYYWDRYREYLIPVHDGGTSGIVIRYCPWCGRRLPESLRETDEGQPNAAADEDHG